MPFCFSMSICLIINIRVYEARVSITNISFTIQEAAAKLNVRIMTLAGH